MDPVTHALLGATLARAAAPAAARLSVRERVALGAAAAVLPDADFALFPVDPLRFLADWHQGATHSLVLMPLWAAALAAVFAWWRRRRDVFGEAAVLCALALASHALLDAATAYGTRLLAPLSDARFTLGTTFVIDPLPTLLLAAALAWSLRDGRRTPAIAAIALLAGVVGAQAALKHRALEVARASAAAHGIAATQWAAWPQPFSPFHWLLVARDGAHWRVAHLKLVDHPVPVPDVPGLRRWHALAAAYRPAAALRWQARERPDAAADPLTGALWHDPRMAPFRRFAAHPAVSAVEHDSGSARCVWFTDLRYDLPALPDTFRYGFCRDADGAPWRLHRLRYFSTDARQPLD